MARKALCSSRASLEDDPPQSGGRRVLRACRSSPLVAQRLRAGRSRPQVIANALVAPRAAVFDHWRRRILAGEQPRDLIAELLDAADCAYDLLKDGIASYPPHDR